MVWNCNITFGGLQLRPGGTPKTGGAREILWIYNLFPDHCIEAIDTREDHHLHAFHFAFMLRLFVFAQLISL